MLAPPAKRRSSPAMSHPWDLSSEFWVIAIMHNNACSEVSLAQNSGICILFHVRLDGLAGHVSPLRHGRLPDVDRDAHDGDAAPIRLRGPRALMHAKCVCKFRDGIERRPRRFTMRRMSGPRDHRHIDRTIALFLRDLDLADGAILVVGALQDRDRNADIGEVFRDIPVAEFGVEPGAVPAIEGVVDVVVPARQLRLQVRGLIGLS